MFLLFVSGSDSGDGSGTGEGPNSCYAVVARKEEIKKKRLFPDS